MAIWYKTEELDVESCQEIGQRHCCSSSQTEAEVTCGNER